MTYDYDDYDNYESSTDKYESASDWRRAWDELLAGWTPADFSSEADLLASLASLREEFAGSVNPVTSAQESAVLRYYRDQTGY